MTVAVPIPGEILHWLGGQIDIRVEIDTGAGGSLTVGLWDEALWDESLWGSVDPDWFDMTGYVLDISIDQGAERWGERFQAGTAVIVVDNTSGIFTPGSDVPDPFLRAYRPGRRVRVVAIPDPETGEKIPIFTGRLDASIDGHDPETFDIIASLVCIDFMGDWGGFNPLAGDATGVQSTDARVEAALDRYGWPAAARDIQAGDHNVASSELAQTTLEECQRAADAEGGAFFCSKDGLATFKSKDWLTTDTRSTVIQGYIGYDEVPTDTQAAYAEDIKTSWELARVVNDAKFARVGSTVQEASDVGSQAAYGKRTYQRTDLQNSSDAEVLALAVRYVNSFKDSRMRVDEVTIAGVDDPDNEDLNRLLWATELGDRLSVLIDTPYDWSIEREVHVMGIHHRISGNDWSVRLRLDDAQTIDLTYWKLEDPELGVLGETTRTM